MTELTPEQMKEAVSDGIRRFLHEQFDHLFRGYEFRHLIAEAIKNGVKEHLKERSK